MVNHVASAIIPVRSSEKVAAEQMRVSEIRYRRLFETANDGILILDSQTRQITAVNPFMEQLLGYTREEFLGKELFEIGLLKDEKASQEAFTKLHSAGFIRYEDLPLQTKCGERREVEFVSNLYDEDGSQVIQCNIRDITARKSMEATLRASEEQLRSSRVAIEEYSQKLELRVAERTETLQTTVTELESFSYSISHDLRAPLRAMQSFAAALEVDCGPQLGLQGKDYVRRIMTAAGRMDALIQDVLVYSRIARQDVPLERIELGSFAAGIVESYPQFDPTLATIELVVPLGAVGANATALTQCFSNLIGNAIKFVREGEKPQLRIWTEVKPDFRVKILFRDNGIGIEPAELTKIFSIFHQSHPGRAGTGIGLAVVRKAAERMGGTISVESKLGEGSTFCLELKSAFEI